MFSEFDDILERLNARVRYYDRDRKPIDMMQWVQLNSLPGYQRIAQTRLSNEVWVSTIWLGLDHGFGDGDPIIFETMAFSNRTQKTVLGRFHISLEQYSNRYSTEKQAVAGHERIVQVLQREIAQVNQLIEESKNAARGTGSV